jgi:histone-arginine methyltransferase CARM1
MFYVLGEKLANGSSDSSWKLNKFDKKIEASSAKMYFHYYGQLLHQQNMLQDYVRTGCVRNYCLCAVNDPTVIPT